MPAPEALIASLREALKLSPENVPLRVHLGDLLLRHEDFPGAEKEFRQAMAQSPADETARLGLVEAFFRQGKYSSALALLEGWWTRPEAPASVRLWAARVHAAEGKMDAAKARYREALDRDPTLADPALSKRME